MSNTNWRTCSTEYCGIEEHYFCIVCRHYVWDCRCTPSLCACGTRIGWAAKGERPALRKALKILDEATR